MRNRFHLLGVGVTSVLLSPVVFALATSARAAVVEPVIAATTFVAAPTVMAPPPTIDVGSNGSDAALNFVPDVANGSVMTIDLRSAHSAPGVTWQTISPIPGRGVYDAAKWAVVFHYTSVNIPSSKTVKFTNHPSGAPVVWLVSGDVLISGTVNLDGEANGTYSRLSIPGPGGFRGGLPAGFLLSTNPAGSGFGPGGGRNVGQAGSHATLGLTSTSSTYGSEQCLPLIGGSGASGASSIGGRVGGAGGGAILIAANSSVVVNGLVSANGGEGFFVNNGGAGGAIRIVTATLSGTGQLRAIGNGEDGGFGRIRLESLSTTGPLDPLPKVGDSLPDNPPLIWLPSSGPKATIVSVGTKAAPADPHAELSVGGTDVDLEIAGLTTVIIACENVPSASAVKLLMTPKYGNTVVVPATFQSGTTAQSQWSANVTLPIGYAVLQVHATL